MNTEDNAAEVLEQWSMNKASSDAVKDILETLHEDPWIESECYHGDLLMALKLFLKKQT